MRRALLRIGLLLLGFHLLAGACLGAEALQDSRVLLLYSYHPGFPTTEKIHSGVFEVLAAHGIQIDEEFMDARHLSDPESAARYREWLAYRLARKPRYDLVISADDAAFNLATDHGTTLFGNVPVVFLGVNNVERALALRGSPRETGVIEHVSIPETFAQVQRLMPGLKRMLVIADGSPGGRADLLTLRAQHATRFPEIAIEVADLTQITWDELARRLERLAPDEAALLLAAYRDVQGKPRSFENGVDWIIEHANGPVFHLWEHGIGRGLVGGYVMSHREHGLVAADMALRILNGTPPQSIPIRETSPNRPIFDHAALQRWHLAEDLLAPDARVINRPTPVWRAHPVATTAAAALVAGLALIALALALRTAQRRRVLDRTLRERALLRTLLDSIADPVFAKDQAGRFIVCNPAFERLSGTTEAKLVGRTDHDLWERALADLYRTHDQVVMACGEARRNEEWIVYPEGRQVRVDTLKSPILDGSGKPIGLIGICHDISAAYEAALRLRQADAVFRNTAEGIVVTDAHQRILAVNPALIEISGYQEAELLGKSPGILDAERPACDTRHEMSKALQSEHRWVGELWLRRKNGQPIPVWATVIAVRGDDDQIAQYIAVLADITPLKDRQHQLELQAHHDPLTGLPNRTLLQDRLQGALHRARRDRRELALLFVDLDRFKEINDCFGHATGDEVLRETARRIAGCIRLGDTVARLGGDEFVAILDGLDHENTAEQAVARIHRALEEPLVMPSGKTIRLCASIGVARYPSDGQDAEALLGHADSAMYRVKSEHHS
ncbi:diguanylate cyclase [Niveibacterium sp. 24ML]|uniref:ABC transporter substrate binding protein n=1 Tax=Niveibacterium sp. 24ML TaxID=2985512 RepID=UPI002271D869|nr:ABC transporter substrate binding protein [Niveibacterium sp. 24ML]MCX9154901.1 diguanylate cyclase [Niveibacterium sp. 24ML]